MVKGVDRTPVIDSYHTKQVARAVKKGSSFIEDIGNVLTAKPLSFTLQAVVQSLPTAFDVPQLNSWYQKITSRISYLEAAVLSVVSTFFNFIMTVGSAFCTLVTLGQVNAFRAALKRYASYTGLGGICTAINAVGVFSPKYALVVGGLSGAAIGAFLAEELKDIGKDVEKIGFIPLVQYMYEKFYPKMERLFYDNIEDKSERKKVLSGLDEVVRNLDSYWSDLKTKFDV